MNILTRPIVYRSKKSTYNLYFFGDVHWGSAQCDEDKAQHTIDTIAADESAIVFLMGDLCEFISTADWRFDPDMIAEWVTRKNIGNCQRDYAIDKLVSIKDKIFGAIQGNHENTIERDYDNAVHKAICEKLGIPDLGMSALVRLTFKRFAGKRGCEQGGNYTAVEIYLHHGYGGGRTMGADANRFSEMMRDYRADWFIAGHTHRRYAVPSIQYYINRTGRLSTRNRFYGRSGTFLRGVTEGKAGYAERAGMPALGTGALMIRYHPYRDEAIAPVEIF